VSARNTSEYRKTPSETERSIWGLLRNRQLAGAKFRRQHPIGRFVADFASVEHRLVVELDGGQHAEQTEQDARRTAYLEKRGYKVIRFWNNEVRENPEAVLEKILDALKSR
jgi:very-short-patch-repair endonuclease